MTMPTIEDMKSLQRLYRKPHYHFAYFDKTGFVMAHTDLERASIILEACPLHQAVLREMRVPKPGYYWMRPGHTTWELIPEREIDDP